MAMVRRIISNLIVLGLIALTGYIFFMMYVMNASTPTPERLEGKLSSAPTGPANPTPAIEPAPAVVTAPAIEPAPAVEPAPVVDSPAADPAPAPAADPAPTAP